MQWKAAQQVGTRALELTEGDTCSWADILRDGKIEHLPTTTPIPSTETELTVKTSANKSPSSTRARTTGTGKVSVKTHKKKGEKRKASEYTVKFTKWHGSLQLDRVRQVQERHISRDALDVDIVNLRLFAQHATLSMQEKCSITAVLKAATRFKRKQLDSRKIMMNKITALKRGPINVYQLGFSRLDQEEWLNNSISLRAGKLPRVHYYTMHFFSKLLGDGKYDEFGPRVTLPDPLKALCEELPASGFWDVQNWSKNIDGNMFDLDNLFVPINTNKMHWMFFHVDFRETTIRLYNLLGLPSP